MKSVQMMALLLGENNQEEENEVDGDDLDTESPDSSEDVEMEESTSRKISLRLAKALRNNL